MKSLINKIKRLNEALPQLLFTIIAYAVLVEIIGIWFFEDKIRYTTGLFIGIGCSIFMAVHIAMVISDAVREGKNNPRMLSLKSVMRYLIVCLVLFGTMYFNLGSLIPAVIGLFGLKVCAYLQPLVNRFNSGFKGGEGSKKEILEEEVKM